LAGFSTGTETATHQSAAASSNADIPLHLQAASATFDDYGGIIAGITLTVKAPVPTPAAGESFRYTLILDGVDVIGLEVSAARTPFVVAVSSKIPGFPDAQINSWETKLNGDT